MTEVTSFSAKRLSAVQASCVVDDAESDHGTDDGGTSNEDPGSDSDIFVCSCED